MNILIINHYAGSPKHGMEYRPFYLAREWVKTGHLVRIIASSESHLHQKKPYMTSTATLEEINGIEYIWLKTPAYQGNGLRRVINMLCFLKRLFSEKKEILNNFEPHVIIASSPHPFIFRGAQHIARQTKAKLIYEVRDLWPLSLIEILGMSPYHPLIALMQHEENHAYKKAFKVASLLPKAFNYMSKHGLSSGQFMQTPNGIVADEWNDSTPLPDEYLRLINAFKIRFTYLVGYAGTHGKPNALSFLINAAKRVEKYNIGFVLIGNGPEKENLITLANKLQINNILFLDATNKVMIPSFLSKMNALYIGWEHQPLYRFGISANKLFEYMISGKPIIHSVKAGNDPVEEAGCGISCLPEDSKSIANAIIKLSTLSVKEHKILGEKGKQFVVNHHDYSILAKNYLMNL